MAEPVPDLSSRLATLRRASRALEPDRSDWTAALAVVGEHVAEGFAREATAPVIGSGDWRAVAGSALPEDATPLAEILDLLAQSVEAPGLATTSPMHLGYIPAGGLPYAALGDLLASGSNRYAGLLSVNPGAAALEDLVVRWLGSAVGHPPAGGGTLTSGGSIATITALHAAREATALSASQSGAACIYLTEHTHHCVEKALRVCGLGEVLRRRVATDDSGRMDPSDLRRRIVADRAAGLRPWTVVATAGSTSTGAVDPLEDVAEIADREGIWLHVDAAYGGLFRLCAEGDAVLGGLEAADTLVVDPHKTLFLPYGIGAVLAKDRERLTQALAATADYLLDESGADLVSPADQSVELTRPFRALRLWLPLRLAGAAAFRAALSEKILLARHLHERLAAAPGFEVGPSPDLSILTYRYRPDRADADALNLALADRLRADGRVFVTSTRVHGRVVLRAAVMSFRTHLEHVDEAATVITGTAARMSGL